MAVSALLLGEKRGTCWPSLGQVFRERRITLSIILGWPQEAEQEKSETQGHQGETLIQRERAALQLISAEAVHVGLCAFARPLGCC